MKIKDKEIKASSKSAALKKPIIRKILISDKDIEAALKLGSASISAAIRKTLILFASEPPEHDTDYSWAANKAKFANTHPRNIVLDRKTHEIALKLGQGNASEGIRQALKLLAKKQNQEKDETL